VLRLSRLALLACLPVLLPAAARAGDSIELRWQFKKGQVFKYVLKDNEVRTVTFKDEKFEATTDSEYEWHWTVLDVTDKGTATLELKLAALKVKSTHRMAEFDADYDSTHKNEPVSEYQKQLYNYYDQLRFGKYRMNLGPDGKVSEVYGLDKLLTETTTGTPVAEYDGLNLHDDSFGWLLQAVLGALPGKAVEEGAKWKQAAPGKLVGIGDATGETEMTLEKPVKVGDRTLPQVTTSGTQTIELDLKWGMRDLYGTLKTSKLAGKVRFDPKAGAVQSSETQLEYGGDVRWGSGGEAVKFRVDFKHALALEAKP
jgi:Family of unknown function (DUF6263)